MVKTFVLDTNVLLHSAQSLESFEDNLVVFPMAVIEELDHFKKNNDELGRNARHVIRRLDELRAKGKLGDGVPLDNGGTLRILTSNADLPEITLDENVPDNRIIRVAYALKKKGERVIFVSKDINARLKADALGIEAMDFEREKINFDELYTGYREINVPSGTVDAFYQEELLEVPGAELLPNEFVLMRDETDLKHTALCRATDTNIVAHLCKTFEGVWNIRPRSKEQRMAIELLMDPNVQLVTLVGQAGTGKTLLAIAAALQTTLRHHKYDKILVSRPIMPMGRDIGYLPGAKDEKLGHWMQPIFDNLTFLMRETKDDDEASKEVQKKVSELQKENLLELEAITYIRGRSIPKQYVIIDEAQNLTPHEVKTIISRAGEGTKMVLTGDPYQIDNPYLDASSNGLTYTVERLKGQTLHGHITLTKSERSPLAAMAATLL